MKQRQIILFYLNKLLASPVAISYRREIFDAAEMHANILFNRDTLLDLSDAAGLKAIGDLRLVRDCMAGIKIPDITAPGYDANLDAILNAFNVPTKYHNIVRLFLNMRKHELMSDFASDICSKHTLNDKADKNFPDLVSAFSDTPLSVVNEAFVSDGPLFRNGVLVKDHAGEIELTAGITKLLSDTVCSADDIRNEMLTLNPGASWGQGDFAHIAEPYEHMRRILDGALSSKMQGVNILIYGSGGSGKTELARSVADSIGARLYGLKNPGRSRLGGEISKILQAYTLLAQSERSLMIIENADILAHHENQESIRYLFDVNSAPVIWVAESLAHMDKHIHLFSYCLRTDRFSGRDIKNILQNICLRNELNVPEKTIDEIATKYDMGPGVLTTAVKMAKLTNDVSILEKTVSSIALASGRRATPQCLVDVEFSTDLLNTDADMLTLARQICENSNGLPFSMCLYGVSGAGKSAFAKYLAKCLGRDLLQKRASDLFGRYIGDTEAAIARSFAEAEAKGAILMFDEADSFLMNKQHATKNWEHSCVNEMLLQMENATIPFICTTNTMDYLDQAVLRRFLFKVKYDYMTAEQTKLAFQYFFGAVPTRWPIELKFATPGDFAVVKRKARILAIDDINTLLDMVVSEIKIKPVAKQLKNIGFKND